MQGGLIANASEASFDTSDEENPNSTLDEEKMASSHKWTKV